MTRFIPAADYLEARARTFTALAASEGARIVREGLAGVDVRNLPALDRAPCPFAWPCPFCGEEA